VQRFRLENGKGYWEKFPSATSNPITGAPRTWDSISVVAGWNIVGSISNPVDTSTITSMPLGLRASSWFGYSGGYNPVTQLTPGLGYWVKANGNGKFVFASPITGVLKVAGSSGVGASEVLNSLVIRDSKGNSQTLYFGADAEQKVSVAAYAMPPVPPTGAFDARFETADGGSLVQTHGVKLTTPVEFTINLQSDAYPISVSWKVNKGPAMYEITDGLGGNGFRSKEMWGEGSFRIANSGVTRLSLRLAGETQLPKEYTLSQNYPNPFNPTTSIKYALPVDSKVTIEVYNLLGQRVQTLVSENVEAGYHVAEWDGTGNLGQQLGSGTYFLKLAAMGANGTAFSEVRKLMMLK
jgi:hypothetical protein